MDEDEARLIAAANAGRSGVNLAALADEEILRCLQTAYSATIEEEVPDDIKRLLDRLD